MSARRNIPKTHRHNTFVAGHSLRLEGAAMPGLPDYGDAGPNGPGRGRCSCEEMSPVLPNRASRKRWHREHKALICSVGMFQPTDKEEKLLVEWVGPQGKETT